MAERPRTERRRRFRRGLRRDRNAVAAVVGTLLALLVFFALFGVFLTQVLPTWMSQNEQALTVNLQSSIATLKSGIDLQTATGGPAVYGTPFTLASASVPLFSQPTTAIVSFSPSTTGVYSSATMTPAPGGAPGTPFSENFTVGTLKVQVPSRYYAPQTFSYEDDAVVQVQSGGQQVVDFPPSFSVNATSCGVAVTANILVLTGTAAQASTIGTQEIFSHYVSTQTVTATSTNCYQNATLVEGTSYPCAWSSFFSSTIATSVSQGGVSFGTHYPSVTHPGTSCPTTQTAPALVKVSFVDLYSFTLIWSEVRLVLGVGTE